MIYAAERMNELLADPEITSQDLRTIPTATPAQGVGIVEAPRGTLIHHYETDEQGLITPGQPDRRHPEQLRPHGDERGEGRQGPDPRRQISDGLLNRVEMAFRAYDPCNGCATHSLPGEMPLVVRIRDAAGQVIKELTR